MSTLRGDLSTALERLNRASTFVHDASRQALQGAINVVQSVGVMNCPDWSPHDEPALPVLDNEPNLVYSTTHIGARRLTWKELCEAKDDELRAAQEQLRLISDLDRCVHGRHEQDDCSSCQRDGYPWNAGNPYLEIGGRLGTTLGVRPIAYDGRRLTEITDE